MLLTRRDAQTLATLTPEEIAICFVVVKLCFPVTWLTANGSGGLLDYIGRRYFREGLRQ